MLHAPRPLGHAPCQASPPCPPLERSRLRLTAAPAPVHPPTLRLRRQAGRARSCPQTACARADPGTWVRLCTASLRRHQSNNRMRSALLLTTATRIARLPHPPVTIRAWVSRRRMKRCRWRRRPVMRRRRLPRRLRRRRCWMRRRRMSRQFTRSSAPGSSDIASATRA